MKKKLIVVPFVMCLLGAICLFSKNRTKDVFFEENVEALSSGEGGVARCYSSYHDSDSDHVYICGSCEWINGLGTEKGGWCW